jgi:hypothetical protein
MVLSLRDLFSGLRASEAESYSSADGLADAEGEFVKEGGRAAREDEVRYSERRRWSSVLLARGAGEADERLGEEVRMCGEEVG